MGPPGTLTGPGGPLAPGSGSSGAAGLAYASMPVERSGGTDRTELVELMFYVVCSCCMYYAVILCCYVMLYYVFVMHYVARFVHKYEFVRHYRRYETLKLFSADVTKRWTADSRQSTAVVHSG